MNVLFMAREYYASLSALEYLISKEIYPLYAILRPNDEKINQLCRDNKIPTGSEDEFLHWITEQEQRIDYLFSFYWKLIKPNILTLPHVAAINFHPGPLPEARGSGYHAAILENWGYWGVTAHFMDATFDTGDIIECRKFPIAKNIVNCDLVNLAHKKLAELFVDVVDKIIRHESLPRTPQAKGQYYSKQDVEVGKDILPIDTEEQIARKIRAFWHPPYTGAQITIKNKKYTVIDENILQHISDLSLEH